MHKVIERSLLIGIMMRLTIEPEILTPVYDTNG